MNPIERVEHTNKASSERQASSDEKKDKLEFHKYLLKYYNSKAAEFQETGVQRTNTYGAGAEELFYEAGNTVNFFG